MGDTADHHDPVSGNIRKLLDRIAIVPLAHHHHREVGELSSQDPECANRNRKALLPVQAAHPKESPARRDTPVVAWDPRRAVVKVHPLAAWTLQDVDAYIEEHGILVNPLVEDGYPSIGCAPCTARVEPGEDPRSGRWAGQEKTECGIHP